MVRPEGDYVVGRFVAYRRFFSLFLFVVFILGVVQDDMMVV